MNAVKLLKKQHREVKKLFREAENAASPTRCQKVAEQICDQLAVHAAIEEKLFYPAAMAEKTADQLREAVEEHLGVKRIIADILKSDSSDPQYAAKVTVLKEMVEHHVEEEEESLFPRTEKLLSAEELDTLGSRMAQMAEELMAGNAPRLAVPSQTTAPAPLPEEGRSKRARRNSEARA